MPGTTQFCTFYLDGILFGIHVQRVQEVIRYQEMTRVPLMPREVRGLINLRGQIVPALDLRKTLGLDDRRNEEMPMNVVIRSEEGAMSFLVDEIGDVLEVQDESFEKPPETLQGVARELVEGVYKLPNRLLLVLDPEKTASWMTVRQRKEGVEGESR